MVTRIGSLDVKSLPAFMPDAEPKEVTTEESHSQLADTRLHYGLWPIPIPSLKDYEEVPLKVPEGGDRGQTTPAY
ncbi:hypothetical protein EYF80_036555 [Liparis tanakae]|uniref:Uncharacterized protein n=1 Tax=Liparis tanakae TaxID=230148 RepID=A0A4Z2GK80_9TELE|nr:hypothetical protein EYF80_036555 [Liparis tanakae]